MPSAKSGTACPLVSPVAPQRAQEADKADPGEMSEIKAGQKQPQTGKYGSTPVAAYKPNSADAAGAGGAADGMPPDAPKQWVEIQMFDEDGNPVAGEPYQITLPDGTVDSGTTDEQGMARVEGIDPGACQITFPNRDQEAWHPT